MKRRKTSKTKPSAPIINVQTPDNEKAVQRILKDRSLTKDMKKEALRALTKTLQMTVSNCSFVVE